MSNVTPKQGQSWEVIGYADYDSKGRGKIDIIVSLPGRVSYEMNGFLMSATIDDFLKTFKFIPQNDLEWLAVYGYQNDDLSITAERHCSIIICLYHRWKDKRYELGLDDKPQKETKMIDLSIGSTVIVDGGRDRWSDADHLVDVPVKVMAIFDGLGLDDGKSIPMVAVSDKTGSSCCFRADMCKPIQTDEERAINDLIKPSLIFAASSGSYQIDAEKFLNVIKAGKIHGVKWVVK